MAGLVDILRGMEMKYARVLVFLLFAGGFMSCLDHCWPAPLLYVSWREMYPNWRLSFAGGSISPSVQNDSIRLDSMQVTIRLKTYSYIVDSVFHMFNTGGSSRERVGMPKHYKFGFERPENRPPVHDFIRFDAWVDGRKAEFTEESDFLKEADTPFPKLPPRAIPTYETRWMVKEIAFPALALTTIRIRYEAWYETSGPTYSVPREWGEYYCGTARYWKGEIGNAAFIIDGTDVPYSNKLILFKSDPEPRAITDRIQRYEKGNFEPPIKAFFRFGPNPP